MTKVQDPTLAPVRRARTDRGLSLRELARQVGMDAGNLSKIERGQRPLTHRTAVLLERALGTKPYELIDLVPDDVGGGDGI